MGSERMTGVGHQYQRFLFARTAVISRLHGRRRHRFGDSSRRATLELLHNMANLFRCLELATW